MNAGRQASYYLSGAKTVREVVQCDRFAIVEVFGGAEEEVQVGG